MAKSPTSNVQDNDLISARDAILLLAPVVGGDDTAKKLLAGRLRDGNLQLRATWTAQQPDIGPLPTSAPKQSSATIGPDYAFVVNDRPGPPKTVIMPRAWLSSANWEADLRRWDWAYGQFVSSGGFHWCSNGDGELLGVKDIPLRMIIGGAHFLRSEVEEVAMSFGAPARPSRYKPAHTPREQVRRWVAELVVFIHENGVSHDLTANKVCDEIEERLVERGTPVPSKTTVHPIAADVLVRFRRYMQGSG